MLVASEESVVIVLELKLLADLPCPNVDLICSSIGCGGILFPTIVPIDAKV